MHQPIFWNLDFWCVNSSIKVSEIIIISKLSQTRYEKTEENTLKLENDYVVKRENPCGCSLEHEGIHFPRLSSGITIILTDACASLSPPIAWHQRVPLQVFFKFCFPVLSKIVSF